MHLIPREDLDRLLNHRGTCVSIYLPTHRSSPDSDQDPIRLKNLTRDAETQLTQLGLRQAEIDPILQPARDLLDNLPFWIRGNDGLAIFLGRDFSQILRLPLHFEEDVVVNDRLYIKPMLPLLDEKRRFFVLAASQNGVRLLEGSPYGVWEIPLEDVPRNLAEALNFDDMEQQLQYHTVARSGWNMNGRPSVTFHGHGVGKDDAGPKKNVERYFQKVNKGLAEHLRDRREPLVFAGVGYLFPLFKGANTYPHLQDTAIEGNPDILRAEELQAAAWRVVAPLFDQQMHRDADRFRQLAANGKAMADLADILPAARQGRVEALFVSLGDHRWGEFDGASAVALHGERRPGDEDLLDRAALETLFTGGRIHPVPKDRMPSNSPAAAILRF